MAAALYILPEMRNNITIMEQRKTAILTVKTEGKFNFFLIGYDGLEDLSQEISNLFAEGDWVLEPAIVTLSSGKSYKWDTV
jgi:hypothetical protein